MNAVINELRDMGCDVDCIQERFLGDEEFFLELLHLAVADKAFDHLTAALEQRDVKNAFAQAHSLKGSLGNMGLTPLYELACSIVEPLRAGDCPPELREQAARLIDGRDRLQELLK